MKIGILGGSFNPVHCGHINLASKAEKLLRLDKMLIIPAGNPPHKKLAGGAENSDRFNMVDIAFSDKINYNVLNIEISNVGPCYTADTVTELKQQYKDDTLYLIMGTDMILTLQNWYRPEMICKSCVIVGAPRNKNETELIKKHSEILKEKYNAQIEILEIEPLSISSTQIRDKIKTGESLSGLIPDKVYEYIKKRGLYK